MKKKTNQKQHNKNIMVFYQNKFINLEKTLPGIHLSKDTHSFVYQ